MREKKRAAWGIAAFLAAAAAILLHEVFLGKGLVPADGIFRLPPWRGRFPLPVSNYLLSDQYLALLPLREFARRRGLFAFWNPYIYCGAPSIGSMQAAPFFPLHLLFFFLDPFWSAGPIAFLKIFLAGLFTALFLRRLGASAWAALYGGLAFALSGFMIVWLGHPQTNAACFFPLALYFLEPGLRGAGTVRSWALAALALGALLLGGHAPTAAELLLALAAYAAFRIARQEPQKRRRSALLFAAAIAAALLLAAPQILPYLQYYALSSTTEASARLERWRSHLPAAALFHFLLPLASGSPARGCEVLGAAWGLTPESAANFNERAGWVDVLSLVLAAAAVWRKRDADTRFFAAAAAASLWLAFGLFPAPALLRLLPILRDVNPMRFLLVADFSLAVLAAFGLDALARLERRDALRLAGASALAAALALVALAWRVAPLWSELLGGERAFLARQILVFLLAAGAGAAAALGHRSPGARPFCVAWTSLELLFYGWGYNPALARSLYYPATPALEFLLAQKPGRIFALGWTLPPNTGILYGLRDARGQDFAAPRRYEELVRGSAGEFFFYSTAPELPPSWPSLGVQFVLAPKSWASPPGFAKVYDQELAIYRTPGTAERARLFFNWDTADPGAILARLRAPGFAADDTLLLEEAPKMVDGPAIGGPASAAIIGEDSDQVLVDVQAPRTGLLLLRDTDYPGWRAEVDGKSSPILRADYDFRAVAVPAGHSRVRFFYRPWAAYAGIALGALALLFLLALARSTRAL